MKYIFLTLGSVLIAIAADVANALFDNFIAATMIASIMVALGSWFLGTVGNIWRKND